MLYEGFSLSSRIVLYDRLVVDRRKEQLLGSVSDWPISFAIGSLTQCVLLSPLFVRHLTNHASDSISLDKHTFLKKAKSSSSYWFQKNPLIWLRGGVLGALTLTFYERVLTFLHFKREELTSPSKGFGDLELSKPYTSALDNSVHEFVHSVKDNSDILFKLEYLGYF